VVSDHIGSAVDASQWYAVLAMDYPRALNPGDLAEHYPGTSQYIKAWNLGLLELLYLIPVNAFILWYAFRSSKRPNAGMVTVLTGVLYAPVRFFLDYLRVNPEADPRYFGLTFAQWASIVAFGAAIALAVRIAKTGKPAETVAKTSGDAQRALKVILKEDEAGKDDKKALPPKAIATETAKSDAAKSDAADAAAAEDDDDEEEESAPATSAAKPAGTRPRPQGGGSSKKNKKRKR
jgi:hypothetical protein